MDLTSGFDIPNPYGLRADDFDHDMDGYRAALGFLGDLVFGVDEPQALEQNGGSQPALRRWSANGKFRRVLAKARAAGAEERAHTQPEEAQQEAPDPSERFQRFIPLEDMPAQRSAFSGNPAPGTWGQT